MTELRGIWFALESDPGPENIGDLIRGAVMRLPDGTHARVTTMLPGGTVVVEEGQMVRSTDSLIITPSPSGDDEMTGWPRRIPWSSVISVEVS